MGTNSTTPAGNRTDGAVLPAKNGPLIILTDAQERGRFLRFLFVGLFGAVVDFGTFNLITHLSPVPPVIAQAFSFLAAVVSNFLWNRYWTYPDSRSKPISSQLGQFALVSGIGLAIRTPIVGFLDRPLGALCSAILPANFAIPPNSVGHNLALAIGVFVVMMWNFFANRYWTYNDVG